MLAQGPKRGRLIVAALMAVVIAENGREHAVIMITSTCPKSHRAIYHLQRLDKRPPLATHTMSFLAKLPTEIICLIGLASGPNGLVLLSTLCCSLRNSIHHARFHHIVLNLNCNGHGVPHSDSRQSEKSLTGFFQCCHQLVDRPPS